MAFPRPKPTTVSYQNMFSRVTDTSSGQVETLAMVCSLRVSLVLAIV